MEHLLKKSRVCLAGRLNAIVGLNPKMLDKSSDWERIKIKKSQDEYNNMKSRYYQSLLQSMIEIDDEVEHSVCHYKMKLPNQSDNLIYLKNDDKEQFYYPCKVKSVRLWFFPYKLVLFSIDIEESAESFSDITLMHRKWKTWPSNYEEFHTRELDILLSPLTQLTKNNDPSQITYSGTKIRQFQAIETEALTDEFEVKTIKDELLYELGTFSDIGVVADSNPKRSFKPSTDYYNQIIRDNTLSVYSNWKALALNDSFTVLAIDDFFIKNEFEEDFELLYMRCLLEEFYCFDRNNLYREGKAVSPQKIESEIAYMEQHYFFDDMSYDFLPPIMYRTMAKGFDLQKDRDQLIQNVKQALRDARQERNSSAVNFVQIFAIFSVVWTIHEMITKIFPCVGGATSAIIALIIAVVITILLLDWPLLLTRLFHNN